MLDHPAINQDLYGPKMLDFVSSANAYCAMLEALQGEDAKGFIASALQALSTLYSRFLLIPDFEPRLDGSIEPHVSEGQWSAIYQRVALLLGSHNEYLRPAERDEFDRSDLVAHYISEDLADLYQELRDFTIVYSRGMEDMMNDAGWELKERFCEHWGRKLLSALKALHELYVEEINPLEE
ncbi:MAG: hypothetical protein CSA96_00710 [Bacteroidetes bacterium]|nr:MAG: hypothetical protein CSA96_00710 [Bacteroidota bacterium]